MRIWIVSEFYESINDTVGGYYVKGLAEKLASTENVEVIFPSRKSDPGSLLNSSLRINNIHHFNFNRKNLITRTFGQVLMSLQFFFFLLPRVKRGDPVISFTHPTFLIFISAFLKRIKHTRTIIVNYDLFPEILPGTSTSGEGWLYQRILRMFNRAYNNADIIISLGKDMTRILESKILNKTTRIFTIPNWADTGSVYFQPKERNEIIRKYKLESRIVFSYAGTIGRCQGLENLLDLIDHLELNSNIHFLFFGKGITVSSFLHKISDNRNRSLITYAGFISTKNRKEILNACDIAIISLLEGMTGFNFPSKTYNIMASGHPILFVGSENSEMAEMITRFNIGWICPNSDIAGFQRIINDILKDPAAARVKGENARRVAENYFAKDEILERYYNAILEKNLDA